MKTVLAVIKTLGLALAFPLVLVLGALIGAVIIPVSVIQEGGYMIWEDVF